MGTTAGGLPYPDGTGKVRDGNDAIQALAEAIDSKLLSAWTPYVPTLTRGGAIGNATRTGAYRQVGKTVDFWALITLGSTTTITGTPGVNLPVPIKGAYTYSALRGEVTDYGTANYPGYVGVILPNEVLLYTLNAVTTYAVPGNINGTTPFTWTTNDFIELHGTYEAA